MGAGGAAGCGVGNDRLNATAGAGALGATGAGAIGATGSGATGAGATGALDEALPMRMEVSGSPFEPNKPVTVSGTSTFLCPARRGNWSGFSWERISAKGNSTGVWSWSLCSVNTPAGEAWRSSPKEIFTEPCCNCVRTFWSGMEICTPPTGGCRTRVLKGSGNLSKTGLSRRRTESPIDGCSVSSKATSAGGGGGVGPGCRAPGV